MSKKIIISIVQDLFTVGFLFFMFGVLGFVSAQIEKSDERLAEQAELDSSQEAASVAQSEDNDQDDTDQEQPSLTAELESIRDDIEYENSSTVEPSERIEEVEQAQEQGSPFPDVVMEDTIISDKGEFPLREYSTSITPNDPGYNQWWVDDQGLETAWDSGSGSTQTSIAIIDTGFDLGHEEFAGRWLENVGEMGATTSENPSDLNCTDQSAAMDLSCNNIDDDFDGVLDNESGFTTIENPSRLNCTDQSIALDKSCNLIDDDGNGFVDDWRGWDFAHHDHIVEAGEVDASGPGNYHGTQVAGVAAATGNNGVGVAGIDWNAKILPLQVFDDYENATSLTVGRAVIYAADQNVDVINLSLGSVSPDLYLRYAIQYALDSGAIVVAASGNDGCECINYPANYPEVVAVGATSWTGDRVYFSNWGDNLDVTAPGVGMSLPNWSASSDSAYSGSSAGTSFSAPLVSGLLSLAKSHQPDASWDELVSSLASTGVRVADEPKDAELGFAKTYAQDYLARLTTPVTFEQVYAVDSSETRLYFCSDNPGSHTMYRMTNGSDVFYAINSYELFVLEQSGWNVTDVTYVCTILPGDTINTSSIIDPLREFENQNNKP